MNEKGENNEFCMGFLMPRFLLLILKIKINLSHTRKNDKKATRGPFSLRFDSIPGL